MRALVLVLLVAAGAANARSVVIEPIRDQEVVWEAGTPFGISRSGALTLSIAVVEVERKRAWLALTVANHGERAVTVYDHALHAYSNGDELRVYRLADLEKREKRKRMWENIGVALAAGASGYAAGVNSQRTETTQHHGQVDVYGARGHARGVYSGTSTTTYYDPSVSARAGEQMQQLASQVRAQQEARLAALTGDVFRTQTVRPGEIHGGRLQIDLPRAGRAPAQVEVTVMAGDEQHRFILFVDGQPAPAQRQALLARYPAPAPAAVPTARQEVAAREAPVAARPEQPAPPPPPATEITESGSASSAVVIPNPVPVPAVASPARQEVAAREAPIAVRPEQPAAPPPPAVEPPKTDSASSAVAIDHPPQVAPVASANSVATTAPAPVTVTPTAQPPRVQQNGPVPPPAKLDMEGAAASARGRPHPTTMALLKQLSFAARPEGEHVILRLAFTTAAADPLAGSVLLSDTDGTARLLLPMPLSRAQAQRGRFHEDIEIPLDALPPGAAEWLRGTRASAIAASYMVP